MTPLSADDILGLLRRAMPDGFVDGYLSGPGGAAVVAAIQAVLGRVSAAAVRNWAALAPGRADLGAVAAGPVRLSRTGTPAGTLLAGTVLWDIHGERVILASDATFAAGNLAPQDVTVVSFARSFQANLTEGTVLAVATPVPSPLFDPTLVATVLAPGLLGGRPPALEVHASARGIGPRVGESAAQLRVRMRQLADTITRAAVERQATAEIAAAQVVEIIDLVPFAFGEAAGSAVPYGAWFAGNSSDPGAAFATRRPVSGWAINAFCVTVPESASLPTFFYAGFSYALMVAAGTAPAVAGAGCYTPPLLAGTMPDGSAYDLGNPGDREDVARLAARVESARPAGVRWWIEEV